MFNSQDLEEENLLELTNDPNVRMIKLLVFENHYLILQSVTLNEEGEEAEYLSLVSNKAKNPDAEDNKNF